MTKYEIQITDAADNDLGEIFDYGALSLKEPAVAARLVARLYDAIKKLSDFPMRSPLSKDIFLAKQGFRILFIEKYIVFYVVDNRHKKVIVHRVIYAKRQYRNLFEVN